MKILYIKSNSNRNKRYQIQTIIFEENGKKFVKKRALHKESLAHIKRFLQSYKKLSKNIKKESIKLAPIVSNDYDSVTFEYIEGKSFWSKYYSLKSKVDRYNFINNFVKILYDSFETSLFDSKNISSEIKDCFGDLDYSILDGKDAFCEVSNIDFLFSNLIYTPKDELYIIDYEWVIDGSLPIDFSLYRVFRYLNIPYYIKNSDFYKKMEDNFIYSHILKDGFESYSKAYRKNNLNIVEENLALKKKLDNFIKEKEYLEKNNIELRNRVKKLENEKEILENINEELQSKVDSMFNSKRWKLFAPLDWIRENNIGKSLYIKAKSNRFLREVYHKLPISNESKWRIREFLTTGQFKNSNNIWLNEDILPKLDRDIKYFPKVSIIIPYYNQYQYIWESVSSAYASYGGELEVIVVNDGSSDIKSINILNELKYFFNDIKIINKENGGLSSARNCGLKYASGEYIQFLDADDALAPGKIDIQISHYTKDNKDSIMICNYLTANEDFSKFYKTEETIKGNDLELENFLFEWERGLSVPIHCAIFPSKIFDKIEFDTQLSAKEDWVFWCNALSNGYKIEYIDIYAVVYRVHSDSMVRKSFVKMAREWSKAYEKLANSLDDIDKDRFIKESKEWLNRYYYSNPNYKLELESKQNKKSKKIIIKKVISSQNLKDKIIKMNKDKPIFTIIIPIFNHYKYIYESIESALNQEGSFGYEIICIDDNSTDKRVVDFLKELQNLNPNFKVILNSKNLGISEVQNRAVEMARGEYIAFLDCDDYISNSALLTVYLEIKNKKYDYIFSDRINIDKDGNKLYEARYQAVMSGNLKDDLLDRMIASHLKVIKKDSYLRVGGSSIKFSGIQDWELALKIAEFGEFKYINKALYYHRIHQESVSSSHNIGQIKKSNILRREYLNRWIRQDKDYKKFYKIIKESGIDDIYNLDNIKVFNQNNLKIDSWYAPKDLKSSFANSFCILDLRDKPSKSFIDFAKDFNSYFDIIICDRLSIATNLIGVVYSPSIIFTPNRF